MIYYQRALELYSLAVLADPGDLEDAVNAVIMRNHLGRAHLRAGELKAANEQYESARASAEEFSGSSPDNIEVLYALADTYAGMGDVEMAREKSNGKSGKEPALRQASAWFQKSMSIWQKIPHRRPVSPNGFEAGDPRDIARRAKRAADLAAGRS
jgi:tetratricopeptide (TPR) repeat protein